MVTRKRDPKVKPSHARDRSEFPANSRASTRAPVVTLISQRMLPSGEVLGGSYRCHHARSTLLLALCASTEGAGTSPTTTPTSSGLRSHSSDPGPPTYRRIAKPYAGHVFEGAGRSRRRRPANYSFRPHTQSIGDTRHQMADVAARGCSARGNLAIVDIDGRGGPPHRPRRADAQVTIQRGHAVGSPPVP